MDEVIKEGTWTCPNCQSTNRGRDVKCGQCGQSREEVAFKYDPDAPAVAAAAELAVATAGPDWICAYCSTSNRATLTSCRQCGAVRAEGKARAVTDVAPAPAAPPRPVVAAGVSGWLKAALGAVVAIVGVLLALSASTREDELTLTRARWERTIAIEALVSVVEEAWAGQVPSGARVLSSRRDVYGYDKVPTGTERVPETYSERVKVGTKRVKVGVKDLGNGFFKEIYEDRPIYKDVSRTRTVTRTVYARVPIYRDKVRYEIDRWRHAREVTTSGDDTAPVWGEVVLGPRERAGKRQSTTRVWLTSSGGKVYEFSPPEAVLVELKPGERYKVTMSRLGKVREIHAPPAGGS